MNQKDYKPAPDNYWEPLWPGKPLNHPMAKTGETWVNDKCQVFVYDYPVMSYFPKEVSREEVIAGLGLTGWPQIVELSLKLNTREPWQDWRDFYRIKSELCGTACWGMQMYPPQEELLDTANQYHMYVLDPSCDAFPIRQLQPPFTDYSEGWEKVVEEGKKHFGIGNDQLRNAKQRPWQEHHKCDDLPLIGPVWRSRGWSLDEEGKPLFTPSGAGTHGNGTKTL